MNRCVHVALLLICLLAGWKTAEAESRILGRGETRLRGSISVSRHTCQLTGTGNIRCWGPNPFGQLGDGSTADRSLPVLVTPEAPGFEAVASGNNHTCGLRANGLVYCWGAGNSAQLGYGNVLNRLTPEQVVDLDNVVAISAGQEHTCALRSDRKVFCWGSNVSGALGDGTTSTRTRPVMVTGISTAVSISAGQHHTCAALADGTAKCWGNNASGQLGNGSLSRALSPVSVSGINNAIAVVTGGAGLVSGYSCALLADGTIKCWGANANGQLGDGTTTRRLVPVQVGGLSNVAALAPGGTHNCALLADGTARCWGSNTLGQLGDGGTADTLAPTPVVGLSEIVALSAGQSHTCAVHADGTAFCWGTNNKSELGNGTTAMSLVPTTVSGGSGGIGGTFVAAGGAHTCASRANGTSSCWGENSSGQLGNGTTNDSLTPTAVLGVGNVVAFALGVSHTCALRADGGVRCWGANSFAQVGDGTFTNRALPQTINIANAVAITAGLEHSCALTADGAVSCWGNNGNHQLGNGLTTIGQVPIPVPGLSNVVEIAAGGTHTCARQASGGVVCWGNNASGQIGDGTTEQRFTPVAVIGLTNVLTIRAGRNHTCAILPDSVRCWGANSFGQIGDGTTGLRVVPVTVNLANATDVSLGEAHTCALTANGRAFCWGKNTDGQLGDNTSTNRPLPAGVVKAIVTVRGQQVPVFYSGLVQIGAGRDHTCALESNGRVLCWGRNASGQIGNDTTIDQLKPAAIPSFTLNIDPNVLSKHSARVATVNILAVCDPGQRLHVNVLLSQGAVSVSGVGQATCTGELESYPVTVPAQGPNGFALGPAQVEAHAVIRDQGQIVDEQSWTRAVQIQPEVPAP